MKFYINLLCLLLLAGCPSSAQKLLWKVDLKKALPKNIELERMTIQWRSDVLQVTAASLKPQLGYHRVVIDADQGTVSVAEPAPLGPIRSYAELRTILAASNPGTNVLAEAFGKTILRSDAGLVIEDATGAAQPVRLPKECPNMRVLLLREHVVGVWDCSPHDYAATIDGRFLYELPVPAGFRCMANWECSTMSFAHDVFAIQGFDQSLREAFFGRWDYLDQRDVSVYCTLTGRRIFHEHWRAHIADQPDFQMALSPEGDRIALIHETELRIYLIPSSSC